MTCQTSHLKAPLAAYAQNYGYYVVFSIFFIYSFVWAVEANLGVREGLWEKRATTTNGAVWKNQSRVILARQLYKRVGSKLPPVKSTEKWASQK